MTQTDSDIVFAIESTFGVSAATPTGMHFIGHMIGAQRFPSPKVDLKQVIPYNSLSPSQINVGEYKYEGQLHFLLTNEVPFYLALGQNTQVDSGAYNWNHIEGVYQNGNQKFNLPSFTLHMTSTGNTVTRFEALGCKVTKLAVTCTQDMPIEATMDILAKSVHNTGVTITATPTLPTPNDLAFDFKMATKYYNLEQKDSFKAATWTIINTIKPIPIDGTSNYYLWEQKRGIGFSALNIDTGDTYFNDIMSQTPRNISMFFDRNGATDRIELHATGCHWENYPIEQPANIGDEKVSQIAAICQQLTVDGKSTITTKFMPTQS